MSKTEGNVIFDTPDGIEYFRLSSAKGAIGLEAKGMKHSRGRSIKAAWQKQLGMKRGSTHEAVIAKLKERMDFLLAAKNVGMTAAQLQALCGYIEKHGVAWKTIMAHEYEVGTLEVTQLRLLLADKGADWLKGLTINFERVAP